MAPDRRPLSANHKIGEAGPVAAHLRVLAGGLALLLLSACATGRAAPSGIDRLAGVDRLLANFEHVVFHDEYDETRNLDRIRVEDNKACLLEEMTQALGLPNDSELIRPSIFNQWDFLQRLPLNDQILVRTLYDQRMRQGMPRDAALTAARGIIAELSARVRRGGPEALLPLR